ncbi:MULTISPECIES: hypothetical protein [unclassified Acidiphilium]|uniref:hypothetical protein n=1 Tax=unclassified Acidiphilium TaxID=2617493 RepID=UPI000BCBCC72|nr:MULTISPECIES: hypothetical protein [unclassified Acidiphilium]OYV55387.1 MAG: hypothetical protein B7Z76_10620 [Acidiphilium sp. 20-67-58]HQT61877.1 hypothetical protein [Acidiphilium sp.]
MTLPVVFAPLVPWPLIAGLALIAALLVGIGLLRRARGSLLRLAGMIFLLAVLASPRWQVQTTAALPDTVLVIRDQTPSMAIGRRAALASAAYRHLSASLPAGVSLRTVDVGGAGGDGSPLFGKLKSALAALPRRQLAGIVVLSDGEATDAPPARLPGDVPLSLLIPAAPGETDRSLRLLSAPRYGLVGHAATLSFEVRDHGVDDAGRRVPVRISVDGQAVRTLDARIGRPETVRLPVAHAGRAVVAVAAAPLGGEISRTNDEAVFHLDGVRRRLTVLLIAGQPNPGLRAWRLLLKSDPAVRLVNFTILRLPDEPMPAPLRDMALIPFPVDKLFDQEIGKFDLIILDQFANDDLLLPPYLANIARHVRAGGALLVEAGPEFEGQRSIAGSPLGPILPVRPYGEGTVTGRFTPALTAQGRRDPVTFPFARDTFGPWYRYETVQQTTGVSLLGVPGASPAAAAAPLLILAHEGKGRVAVLLSDQFWLWARGALAGNSAMQGPATALLGRTVHWLLGDPALAARQLRAAIAGGRLNIRRIAPSGPSGTAEVTAPDGKRIRVALHRAAPGRFEADMPASGPGVWRVSAGGRTAYAAASDEDPAEQQDLAATSSRFAPLVHRSFGHIVWLARTPAPGWTGLYRPRHARLVTGERDIRLPPAIPGAILGLLLVAAGWWRERA